MKLTKSELIELIEEIESFYSLPNCSTGGPLHIITDDYNCQKHSLDYCKQTAIEGGWWNDDDHEHVKDIKTCALSILEKLYKLTMTERYYLLCSYRRCDTNTPEEFAEDWLAEIEEENKN